MSRIALHALLNFIGKRLARASQTNPDFRAALSRDLTIVVAAGDVVHHFVVRDRNITAGLGFPLEHDCVLRFETTGQALRTFLSRNRVEKIVQGALDSTVQVEGNLMLLLWFEGRIQQVVPIGNQLRRPVRLEGAYTAPRDDVEAAAWITREPAVDALDPDWKAAWEQRKKLSMSKAGAGEPHKEF